jgi:hypothetical protein
MSDDDYPSWGEVRQHYLRGRSDFLLGPTRQPISDHDEVGFRVTYLPNGEIIVTLTDTCSLNTVHDLCHLISNACLDGDDDIDFTRDPAEAHTRLRTFGQ